MIALIVERDILIAKWKFYVEKYKILKKLVKNTLFLKFLCMPVSKDLDRDIWQMIFELP